MDAEPDDSLWIHVAEFVIVGDMDSHMPNHLYFIALN